MVKNLEGKRSETLEESLDNEIPFSRRQGDKHIRSRKNPGLTR
jgi:hypothetical protein